MAPSPRRPPTAATPRQAPLAAPAALTYAELAGLGEEGLEAASRANAALTEGVEALAAAAMGGTRLAFQSATEAARGFLGAATLEDVLRLQAELARRNLDGFFAAAAKLSQVGWALAGAAFLPPPARVAARPGPTPRGASPVR